MLHITESYTIKTYHTDTNRYILNDFKVWITEISFYSAILAWSQLQSKLLWSQFSKSGRDSL